MPRKQVSASKSPYYSNLVGSAKFTVGAEIANVKTVTVQLQDTRYQSIAQRASVRWFLSDDANGDSLVATAPDGGVATGGSGWVSQTVTGKQGEAVATAAGLVSFAITHAAGAKTVYLGLSLPDGSIVMSPAITFA